MLREFGGILIAAGTVSLWLLGLGIWWVRRRAQNPFGRALEGYVAAALGLFGIVVTILAAAAMYQLDSPLATARATIGIREIVDLACASYNETGQMPASTPMTPSRQLHATRCEFGLAEFDPDPTLWASEPGWAALGFGMDEPHAYSFRFDVTAGDTVSFTASAFGDLDCDGQFSTFSRFGVVEDGVARMDSRYVEIHDELE